MKKSPLFLSLFISSLLLCSCGKEITLSAEAPKWDVQTCDRIYATDPRNGTWLNIKDNELVSGYVTPMAYGIAVLPKGTKPGAGKKVLTFQEALSEIEDVSKQKAAMKMHKH